MCGHTEAMFLRAKGREHIYQRSCLCVVMGMGRSTGDVRAVLPGWRVTGQQLAVICMPLLISVFFGFSWSLPSWLSPLPAPTPAGEDAVLGRLLRAQEGATGPTEYSAFLTRCFICRVRCLLDSTSGFLVSERGAPVTAGCIASGCRRDGGE